MILVILHSLSWFGFQKGNSSQLTTVRSNLPAEFAVRLLCLWFSRDEFKIYIS